MVSTPNVAPTVSITSPVADATFDAPASITISATAADTDGTISKVEFYDGATLIGSDSTSPYSFTKSDVPAGNYTITVKAYDNSGAYTISSSIVVSVAAATSNVAPTVSIISPVPNAYYDSAQYITIEAAASDSDGTVTKVDFYNGGILLGTKSTSPYTFTWNNVTPGSYSLKAKAYDNTGAATVSGAVSVVVSSPVAFAFTDFSGIANSKENQLAWSTTNYKNTTYFTVLKGKRRTSMKQIGKVYYTNSNSTTLNYIFTDLAPYSGTNYYKIIEVGNLGKTVSSSIIGLSTTTTLMGKVSASSINTLTEMTNVREPAASDLEAIVLKLGPNPASNTLSVFIQGVQNNKELKISILSISGILLKTINSNKSNSVVQVDVSSLMAGTYLLQAVSGDKIVYKQFVKQ